MDKKIGLNSSEIERLTKEFGKNELPKAKEVSKLILFLNQFKSVLIILLIVAGGVSFFLGEYIDGIFILTVVLLNASIGFFQEVKAKNDIAALKKMVTLTCRVVRDGHEIMIETLDLLPGDLLILSEGDKIPADAILLEAKNITVSEASLTGESVPVEKAIGDQIFMSCIVLTGRGMARVEKIGAFTRFGQVAKSLTEISDEQTPLEIQLDKVGWNITILVGICIVLLGLLNFWHGSKLIDVFISSVALAVAAIPEGLPAVLTIALAVGVRRMASRKAIIKRLVATESLGSVDVICTDKTGTLTRNEMTVVEIVNNKSVQFHVSGVGYRDNGKVEKWENSVENQKIIECGLLCNSSSLAMVEDGGSFQVLGDTTEGALLILGKKLQIDYEQLRINRPILEEIPFDSDRRLMTVAVKGEIFSKGALEKILGICGDLSDEKKKEYLNKASQLGEKGYRVLAFAHKPIGKVKIETSKMESDLDFLGMMAIFDPPREEVKEAIKLCHQAGIRVVMLTGDSPQTAKAIGEQTGLIGENEEVITGEQLAKYSQEVFLERVANVSIFSRVSPVDKLKIVSALQDNGKIVAVTGDGVNDAPALKKAQVGVAMGITGTDVAKEAADMVITDDNFSTIVAAIEEGRTIFLNLSRAIVYLLSCNFGEILTVAIALIFNFPLPISPISILWMNLVTDGMPALALAIDTKNSQILQSDKKKVGTSQNLLNSSNLKVILSIGLLLGIVSFLSFALALQYNLPNPRLVPFTVLVVGELLIAYMLRSGNKIYSNKLLLFSTLFGVITQLLILMVGPISQIFN